MNASKRLVILSALLIGLLPSASAGATEIPLTRTSDETPQAPDVVVGDQVVEGGTHYWTHPIVVTPGSSLTIRNATVYLDWTPPVCTKGTAGYCHPMIMVLRGGQLNIAGSTLDSLTWDVDDPDTGYVIHGIGATFKFENSTFQHYKSIGAQAPGPEPSSVTGSTFDWAITGLSFTRGSEVDITNNEFSNSLYGVAVRDGSGNIVGNHFDGVVRNFNGPFGRALDIQATLAGEKQFQTLPLVEGNLIENGIQGILNLNGYANVIRNNVIRNNRTGITIGMFAGESTFSHASPIASGNVLQGNTTALSVYVSGAAQVEENIEYPILEFHGNSFLGSTCNDIVASATHPTVVLSVNATTNWWGSDAGPTDHGPDCDALVGPRITVDPWLTEAP